MEVYYEIGPFVLLAGKDFPRDESLVLVQRDQPLSISLLDTDRLGGKVGTTAKTLTVGLGDDFLLSCDYSLAGGGTNPEHLMLCRRNQGLLETLTDYNVDGVFDLRQTRDEKQRLSRMYVWYRGTWREIMGAEKDPKQDESHKQLLEGERVSFDIHSGQWLSPTDKPIVQSQSANPAPTERKTAPDAEQPKANED